jgi:hypothetical protein
MIELNKDILNDSNCWHPHVKRNVDNSIEIKRNTDFATLIQTKEKESNFLSDIKLNPKMNCKCKFIQEGNSDSQIKPTQKNRSGEFRFKNKIETPTTIVPNTQIAPIIPTTAISSNNQYNPNINAFKPNILPQTPNFNQMNKPMLMQQQPQYNPNMMDTSKILELLQYNSMLMKNI